MPPVFFVSLCVSFPRGKQFSRAFAKFLRFTIKNPLDELVRTVASKLRKRMKNLLSYSHFVHKSLNLVISSCCLAEDGEEICTYTKLIITHVQSYCFAHQSAVVRKI